MRFERAAVNFWAITSYFNPIDFESRRANFFLFRSRLDAPLVAVELGHRGRFDLRPDDADIVVHVADGDLLWQKERLLNAALRSLPPECDAVAWLDCDVVFTSPSWRADAVRALATAPLVQLFEDLIHLEPGQPATMPSAPAPPERRRRSFAAAWGAGALPDDFFRRPELSARLRCNCGMAWAARRTLLERHGLYDSMILGMGDKLVAAAAVGHAADAAAGVEMSPAHAAHYRRWAEPFHREVDGRLGAVPGTLLHLWHGDLANRRYVDRYRGFGARAFDPATHLRPGSDGAWRWGAAGTELRDEVAAYFRGRREDGDAEAASRGRVG